jgi:electron transfer flavoprotein alpha subunit
MSLPLVLVTHLDGAPDDVSLQAVTLARRFAGGGPVHALVVGSAGGPGAPDLGGAVAPALGAHGVATVHAAGHPSLDSFAPDAWARIMTDLAASLGADALVGPGTDAGNDVLARAAARLREPFAANCIAATPGDPITLTRVRWGGSLLEEARLHAGRAVLSVAPHAVAAEAVGGAASVEAFTPQLDDADLVVRVRERIGAASGGVSLADARVVVSGGRGAGSTEGFAPIEDLAGLLGAAVGCSRAVTIAGWRAHTDQVGQTGTKIAPDVYIACGISGATQHMAGCKAAKKILAINNDPEAPIMASADYAVIGDMHEVVPAIAAEIRRVRGG